MKKLMFFLFISCFSVSCFSATEITKKDAIDKNLTKIATIKKTDTTLSLCSDKISSEADAQGAEYYVITAINSVGNGNSVIITSDIYK